MQTGDMIYYLHTNNLGTLVKYAAIVLEVNNDNLLIRVGRFDPVSSSFNTFESTVEHESIMPRSMPFSFEKELQGNAT